MIPTLSPLRIIVTVTISRNGCRCTTGETICSSRFFEKFFEKFLKSGEDFFLRSRTIQIVELAKENGHDLIIMGGRGLSPVTGFLLGSVSQEVMEEAKCAVLVAK